MEVPSPSDWPDLESGEIHLRWGRVGPRDAELQAWLDPSERARAERFHRERDRRRFESRRSFLRSVLGAYVGRHPAQLRFEENAYGKPALESGAPRFNLSVSEDHYAVAIASDREVGVDVESTGREVEFEALAARVFAPAELEAFEGLAEADRSAAFFRIWTRKEALLKAWGVGLSRDPRSVCVSLAAHEGLFEVADDVRPGAWLLDVKAPEGFAAALCAPGGDWRVRVFEEGALGREFRPSR